MQEDRWIAEWQLLQSQCDNYERYALLIKLVAIALATAMLIAGYAGPAGIALVAILWLQDAIWKTFQARLEERLLLIEAQIHGQSSETEEPFQLNTRFAAQRSQTGGLLEEYLAQATRPTVAFPHAAIVVLLALVWLVG